MFLLRKWTPYALNLTYKSTILPKCTCFLILWYSKSVAICTYYSQFCIVHIINSLNIFMSDYSPKVYKLHITLHFCCKFRRAKIFFKVARKTCFFNSCQWFIVRSFNIQCPFYPAPKCEVITGYPCGKEGMLRIR